MAQYPPGSAEQQKCESLMFIPLFLPLSFYGGDPPKKPMKPHNAADLPNCLYGTQRFSQDCVPVSNLEQNLFKSPQGKTGSQTPGQQSNCFIAISHVGLFLLQQLAFKTPLKAENGNSDDF